MPPTRRRSRRIRAAALVTIGLGATGCDEAPAPDLPGQTAARLDACRAAHERLGRDPAQCEVLERTVEREQHATRPRFASMVACQQVFGAGACEGDQVAAPLSWRPLLAGWTAEALPVVRDRRGQHWALPESHPGSGLAPPRPVAPPTAAPDARTPTAFQRLAPLYADRASCEANWETCEASAGLLPNRFAARTACEARWSRCTEVALQVEEPTSEAGTANRSSWTHGYNSYWMARYLGGIGPRYQGWTWTGDRRPVAAYRPSAGTGSLRAWDSRTGRLGIAAQMARMEGAASAGRSSVTGRSTTINRAGFGSTGRSYSAGG